jgi:hypothetical protein
MLAALVAATRQPFLQTIVDVAPMRTVFARVHPSRRRSSFGRGLVDYGVALGRRWAA